MHSDVLIGVERGDNIRAIVLGRLLMFALFKWILLRENRIVRLFTFGVRRSPSLTTIGNQLINPSDWTPL